MNERHITEIRKLIKGEVLNDEKIIKKFSTDASIFEVKPGLIIRPKDVEDIKAIVTYVNKNKETDSTLSITARAAGTCMSGGSLNESIILDMTSYINKIGEVQEGNLITVEPGAYYRDIEKRILEKNLILPSYTASKNLCTIGGMVANNSSGEMTLSYGDTSKYVKSIEIVLSDGNLYKFEDLNRDSLEEKLKQNDFEGEIYKKIVEMIENNFSLIKKSKPHVSKNSSGYLLWNLWDENHINLSQVICGSQGTLGIVTKITLELVPVKKFHALTVLELRNLSALPAIVKAVLEYKPECFESYDEHTFSLAKRYLPESANKVITNESTVLTLIAKSSGNTEDEVLSKAQKIAEAIRSHGVEAKVVEKIEDQEHYWNIRRSSFQLLRSHSDNKERTAPFIDDIIVSPEYLPKFLPRLQTILSEYKMTYTIAGHIGNGNFHLIPLVNMELDTTPDKILELSKRVFTLVFEYEGSMAGEHNDGIIRTPFVSQMFGKDMYVLFKKTKDIFDPLNIFNPGKKVGGSIEYLKKHIVSQNINELL